MAASMAVLFRRTTSLLSQERLQQASVGFSLFSLVISLILFCALEVSKQPFTWLNYRKRSSDPERQRPVSSLSDDNKRDVEDFCRTGKYDRVELLLPRNQSSNSVTSSDLPLPSPLSPALSTGTSTPSWGAAWMHVIPIDLPESPSIDPPMPSPSPAFPGQWPLRSPSPSERPPLRMQRTLSSKSSIYSRGSTLRCSPLSTMRTADCPDVPILPELPKIRRKPLPTEWDLPTALIPGAWKPQLFDAPSEVRLERMTEQQQSLYKDLGLIAEPIAPCVENTKMGKRRRNDSQKWKTQPIARSRAIAQRNGPMGSRGSRMGY
ncbi:MAG: hypothetical protein M1825_005933 [Sarcosagium campestre]|nr:MAG: hypothetical protein M1825_005933 [Sarcosagium campestre]